MAVMCFDYLIVLVSCNSLCLIAVVGWFYLVFELRVCVCLLFGFG